MSEELAIRFNRDELALISKALLTQEDDDSRLLGLDIYKALNPVDDATPASPVAEAKPAIPNPVEEEEEAYVLRSTSEQATFTDDTVVLRQRMSLNPLFGRIHPGIMQVDSFMNIFRPGNTVAECEAALRDPESLQTTDGVPGNVTDRVRRQRP